MARMCVSCPPATSHLRFGANLCACVPLLPSKIPTLPPAHRQVRAIVDKGAQYACSGPFAGTCDKLTTLQGGKSAVMDTSSFVIWDNNRCQSCLAQQAPASICFPKGLSYGVLTGGPY